MIPPDKEGLVERVWLLVRGGGGGGGEEGVAFSGLYRL